MSEKRNISYTEFEEICEKIQKIINMYFEDIDEDDYSYRESDFENKKNRLDKKKELLFLSNGDVLNYVVPRSSVAHLLGIDTNYLASTGLFNSRNSYDILKYFLENSYNFYQKYKEGHINLEKVLSSYVIEKIDSFVENITIDINNCEFICKFDNQRSYGYNDNDMNYLVLTKIKKNIMFLFCQKILINIMVIKKLFLKVIKYLIHMKKFAPSYRQCYIIKN